jgi:hypothetical protein
LFELSLESGSCSSAAAKSAIAFTQNYDLLFAGLGDL